MTIEFLRALTPDAVRIMFKTAKRTPAAFIYDNGRHACIAGVCHLLYGDYAWGLTAGWDAGFRGKDKRQDTEAYLLAYDLGAALKRKRRPRRRARNGNSQP